MMSGDLAPSIARYSSRRDKLRALLPELLTGATRYDRIAGYFSSSILEVAGEALERLAPGACVRIICNSELDPLDVATARAAKQEMFREWCRALPEDVTPALRARLERLAGFLTSGRLRVKVLPDRAFGMIHGKAGIVTATGGSEIAFMGSANESRRAWTLNYEIVWTDRSPEGVAWVREEFDALWHHPDAFDLADGVIIDVQRLTRRIVVPDIPAWKVETDANPASVVVEAPIYRRENGLWAHQKVFVQKAFDAHKRGGARLLLADQVGLGKTVQLALAAKLMALWGGGPVLALVPKPLLRQWQRELWSLLRLPSAVWTGTGWETEQGVVMPGGLGDCPRRVGIVSSGLVTQSPTARDALTERSYECVILDEAHRARRRNLGPSHLHEPADRNNLLQFLYALGPRTKSMLLATATPVQLDPIEAWDLLDAANTGSDTVLGTLFSWWRARARDGLALVIGEAQPPESRHEAWEWIRDPFPPAEEDRDIAFIRRSLKMPERQIWARPEQLGMLKPPDLARIDRLRKDFFQEHNPYIRHIVRRTREYLEETIDPQTGEPYLKPVKVRLFGDHDHEAITLPTFLRDAYIAAEEFCNEVGKRPGMSSGFLKTILLRRIGSTVIAGRKTAEQMLERNDPDADAEDDEEEVSPPTAIRPAAAGALYPLTEVEEEKLRLFLQKIRAATDDDPKYRVVEEILQHGVDGSPPTGPWLERGCIIFSQYLDSAQWVAQRLSARFLDLSVGFYAGGARSGVFRAGAFTRLSRDTIKDEVAIGDIRLLIGTDAASEGLNLQRIGTLINLDLPWNPTRLEQRKGRIQRIGQVRDEVYIYNMRYRDSVEDRVHELLSQRLQAVRNLFGQIPDTLEDVWVALALHDEQRALQIIDQVPEKSPFEVRYDKIEAVDWESCSTVLDSQAQLDIFFQGWQ